MRHEAGSRSISGTRENFPDVNGLGATCLSRTLTDGRHEKHERGDPLLPVDQRYASGGVRLDSMFVDEGFGSLDSESLEKAVNALCGITESGRIVGIISHVEGLKDRIDRQIIVRKKRTGGSTVEVVV